jgi:hypothetical protein
MAKEDEQQKLKGAYRQTDAVIDRIEDGGVAVLLIGDDGKTQIDIPVSLLPKGASDGDRLRLTVTIDRRSRASAEDRIRKLQDQLKQQSGTDEKKDFKL